MDINGNAHGDAAPAPTATIRASGSRSNLRANSQPYHPIGGFCLKTGTTCHMTKNFWEFDPESFIFEPRTIPMGNGPPIQVCGHGCIRRPNLTLPNVLFVPQLHDENAISIRQLDAMDYKIEIVKGGCLVKESLGGQVVGQATFSGGLYKVDYLHIPLTRERLPDYEAVEAAILFAG